MLFLHNAIQQLLLKLNELKSFFLYKSKASFRGIRLVFRCFRCYTIIFLFLLLFTFIIFLFLIYNHSFISILYGTAQSIIASFIFYLFLEFIPFYRRAYQNAEYEMSAYCILRRVLFHVDKLFIDSYQKVTKNIIEYQYVDINRFFDYKFIYWFANRFQEKDALSKYTYRNIWHKATCEIDKLLQHPYVLGNAELYHLLYILKEESYISIYFSSLNSDGQSLYPISFMLGADDNYNVSSQPQDNINNIVKLHKIAFKMFHRLDGNGRWFILPILYFKENQ